MKVDQPGWYFANFQIAFCLANHGLAPLLTFTMQTSHQNCVKWAPQYKKATEPNVQFLGAHAPQAPDLLRQGVPQRDTTLGQLT